MPESSQAMIDVSAEHGEKRLAQIIGSGSLIGALATGGAAVYEAMHGRLDGALTMGFATLNLAIVSGGTFGVAHQRTKQIRAAMSGKAVS